MSKSSPADFPFANASAARSRLPGHEECVRLLGADPRRPQTLPFTGDDVTAGCENELQVAVFGTRDSVDLPQYIETSNYFANIIKRTISGDTSPKTRRNLERYLADNPDAFWENSWVRFPARLLHDRARDIFLQDLRADKKNPRSNRRSDAGRFWFKAGGEEQVRIPISYLLKLALADAVHAVEGGGVVRATGARMMGHLLSDNTSPETFSFHVVGMQPQTGYGRALARETAKRYLFTQLLVLYANNKFELGRLGQKAALFFSPHPPVRQRALNESISDAFYRELFMSPCLSGWNDGEGKYRYMVLCHQVLSRSHLNAVMKLREAGIITNNLVVLPHTSNISLANNSTHISLGSKRLSRLMRESGSGFGARHEKYLGDLVAKIVEHFLPLFVGTHSAAPYRLDFEDFHPEKALGFLPHALDYTHLRMLWRRWRKKARNKVLGHALTPFGPQLLDRSLAAFFGCKGDLIPDFRLIDYPVALLSTEKSASQDGGLLNDARLKEDLDALGVFDKRMSLYLPYKLREFRAMGFSGFEARYYSLFEHFGSDMARAADLQMLLTALAFKYIVSGACTHRHIPDTPFVESERRQILFGSAIGIPTFFVRRDSVNRFLCRILQKAGKIRVSRRYQGYLRVLNLEYRLALLAIIREDGRDLIEMMGLEETLADLERRLLDPGRYSALGKLSRGILEKARAKSPYSLSAREFNQAAEQYYREDLSKEHLLEAWQYLAEDIQEMDAGGLPLSLEFRQALRRAVGDRGAAAFLRMAHAELLAGDPSLGTVTRLLHCMILAEDLDAKKQKHGY